MYRYIATPNTLGIGVDNLAFVRPPIATDFNYDSRRYNVRADIMPLEGAGQFPLYNIGPMTDLRANGVYLSGQLALGALTDFKRANNLA